ncbi:glyoxalase superfamily protein [Bradyrhizobium sp. CER78]|uniref:glyoxalase superfamily protein n=1 Tax=Bradyrhizobium sp. CER78 TaxID=3039162 RepID=UPI00244883D5|nr:glyoxalase superfamily protein [Bradyrhizobium sp. CER78]MDH2386393.1 glyoxalase superfamily protein [Bradyrhizobium sp. CER78]
MIIVMSEERMKRAAKRLRKVLCGCGVELKHFACLDLAVRLCGYKDWQDYRRLDGDEPLSPLDEDLSEEEFAARDEFQMNVLEEAGLSAVARELLDRANPTGSWVKQATAGLTFDDNSTERGHLDNSEDDRAGHLIA